MRENQAVSTVHLISISDTMPNESFVSLHYVIADRFRGISAKGVRIQVCFFFIMLKSQDLFLNTLLFWTLLHFFVTFVYWKKKRLEHFKHLNLITNSLKFIVPLSLSLAHYLWFHWYFCSSHLFQLLDSHKNK